MNPAPIRLALDALHRELGARMAPFAGYEMPIQYPSGLRAEHLHTREHAGLFDVSHMGQLRVLGAAGTIEGVLAALETALPLDFDGWPSGQQRYSVLLNDAGGIVDDLMVLRLDGEVRIIVNAGNRETDLALLRKLCPTLRIDWIDAALLALQGPQAETVLARFDPRVTGFGFMHALAIEIDHQACLLTRSGYTGEDGFEISVPGDAMRVARALLAQPEVAPIGLGARDTLRLEAGLPLHGNDIDPETTPIEARLGFAIARSRRRGGAKAGGFPGASKILSQLETPPARTLVGLSSLESIPIRAGSVIIDANGRPLGRVCSGTVSPSLGRPIMLAYLTREAADPANPIALYAQVRDRRPAVHLVALPFVAKRYKR